MAWPGGSDKGVSSPLDELDEVIARNRMERTFARDTRIVELRRRGVFELTDTGPPTWPPAHGDPFPDVDGIPEIAAGDLDASVLAGCIAHHGSVLVRGLLDPSVAGVLRDDVHRAVDASEREIEGAAAADVAPWCVLLDDCPAGSALGMVRRWLLDNGSTSVGESPPTLFDLLEAYRDAGLLDLIEQHLGQRPVIDPGKVTARRISPSAGERQWHQDGAFFGIDVRTINVWLALSDCGHGTDAPGIEVVPKRLEKIVPTGTEEATIGWAVAQSEVDKVMGDAPTAVPRFAPGDALLFDHFNLHRTVFGPGLTRDRYAIEAWFFSRQAHPKGSPTFMVV